MDADSDEALMARIGRGEQAAFRILARRYAWCGWTGADFAGRTNHVDLGGLPGNCRPLWLKWLIGRVIALRRLARRSDGAGQARRRGNCPLVVLVIDLP